MMRNKAVFIEKSEDDNQLIPFVPDELNYLQIQKIDAVV